MEFGKDFYVFEVLENYEDKLVFLDTPNKFYKGERFVGWESVFNNAVKSNLEEIVCIPLDKVKKILKVNFEEVKY
ncbi:Uncharacterised protein [uncultured Clostridium sp.]|nr:Uncharacterised protein [uncultured Clostridium sp.]